MRNVWAVTWEKSLSVPDLWENKILCPKCGIGQALNPRNGNVHYARLPVSTLVTLIHSVVQMRLRSKWREAGSTLGRATRRSSLASCTPNHLLRWVHLPFRTGRISFSQSFYGSNWGERGKTYVMDIALLFSFYMCPCSVSKCDRNFCSVEILRPLILFDKQHCFCSIYVYKY